MIVQNKTLAHLFCAIFTVMLLLGCDMYNDGGGDQIKFPQTKILAIKVQPDTIASADTATFTCIIEDSTDKRFQFHWDIDGGEALEGISEDPDYPTIYTTENNSMNWKAPTEEGVYSFEVTANNGSDDSLGARSSFSIVVQ